MEIIRRKIQDASVLVADDQQQIREAIRLLLKSQGLTSYGVGTREAALTAVQSRKWSCAIIDLNFSRDTTSGQEGLTLIKELRALNPELPLIAMTAWGSIPIAVSAIRNGADDFIEKPWENTRLLTVLRAQISLAQSRRRTLQLETERKLLQQEQNAELIAHSKCMQRILDLAKNVADSDSSVLVLGESGTGKGVIARQLHDWSARRDNSFIKLNIGGIADNVFESELFGHVRGAFTDAKSDRIGRFELADGGTIFLDEISNINWSLQGKLLRVIEDGEFERLGSSRTIHVDARIISATNVDLVAEVKSERFRRDLLYRLNTIELKLPRLCDRRDDIIPLARRFLTDYARRKNLLSLELSPSAERLLLQYSWPGNVRELRHVMERAALLSNTDIVGGDNLLISGDRHFTELPLLTLDDAERQLIELALKKNNWNMHAAARDLGITRQSLYRRVEKHNIRVQSDACATN